MKVRKAVFPVGGLGTRFLPATKALPKEMLPIVDKPLIQYAVEEAQAAGIEVVHAPLVPASLVHVKDVGQQPGVAHPALGGHKQDFANRSQCLGYAPELQQGARCEI